MTLHRRPDEVPELDPLDDLGDAVAEMEERWCSSTCERCGLEHDEPAERCPTCNPTHLRALP